MSLTNQNAGPPSQRITPLLPIWTVHTLPIQRLSLTPTPSSARHPHPQTLAARSTPPSVPFLAASVAADSGRFRRLLTLPITIPDPTHRPLFILCRWIVDPQPPAQSLAQAPASFDFCIHGDVGAAAGSGDAAHVEQQAVALGPSPTPEL